MVLSAKANIRLKCLCLPLPYLLFGDHLLSLYTQCSPFFVTIFPVKGTPYSYFLTFQRIFCWGEGSDGWRYGLVKQDFPGP